MREIDNSSIHKEKHTDLANLLFDYAVCFFASLPLMA